ncbi:MAG TPA: transcription termination/antitermination NusG family protein [Pyrinomonadaceae bacterium]|nr:transcription termination/antitermination NusG family protein [Pyrinomonadaceae bacterium]
MQWFAVQVQHKYESLTANLLQYKGYETYVPQYTPETERRRQKRSQNRPRTVFPGYVFTRFCWEDTSTVRSGAGIITTPGVIRIVGAGRTPIAVQDEEIETIQRVLDSGLETEPWPYLRVGEQVQIEEGPLRGVTGIIQAKENRHQLVVSVDLLQRSLAVLIDCEWVNPLSVSMKAAGVEVGRYQAAAAAASASGQASVSTPEQFRRAR